MQNGLLQPYMKNTPIEACPDLPASVSTAIGLTGYGYNADYLSPYPPTYPEDQYGNYILAPINTAKITAPSMTVFLADSAQLSNGTISADPWLDAPLETIYSGVSYPNFHGIHTTFGNVLFMDGHVKSMSPVYFPLPSATLEPGAQSNNIGVLDLSVRPANQPVSDELFNGTGAP
jgi:prepilin-type processing-associated H-X9-DG protein